MHPKVIDIVARTDTARVFARTLVLPFLSITGASNGLMPSLSKFNVGVPKTGRASLYWPLHPSLKDQEVPIASRIRRCHALELNLRRDIS